MPAPAPRMHGLTHVLGGSDPIPGVSDTAAPPVDISGKVDRDAVETATARLVAVKLAAGDTQPAFKITGDGKHVWGQGGTTATDTTLYRSSSGRLKTDGHHHAGGELYARDGAGSTQVMTGDLTAAGKAGFGGMAVGNDTLLYRANAKVLRVEGRMDALVTATTDLAFLVISGSTGRWQILGDGKQVWSDAAGTADTYLYRAGVNSLETSSKFNVVFNAGGNKLGISVFVAVIGGYRDLEVGAADSGGTGYRIVRIAN